MLKNKKGLFLKEIRGLLLIKTFKKKFDFLNSNMCFCSQAPVQLFSCAYLYSKSHDCGHAYYVWTIQMQMCLNLLVVICFLNCYEYFCHFIFFIAPGCSIHIRFLNLRLIGWFHSSPFQDPSTRVANVVADHDDLLTQ